MLFYFVMFFIEKISKCFSAYQYSRALYAYKHVVTILVNVCSCQVNQVLVVALTCKLSPVNIISVCIYLHLSSE